jgi:hypothetical protein
LRVGLLGLIGMPGAACGDPPKARAVGEACETTDECAVGLECARIGERRTACLPEPAERAAESCDVDGECTLEGAVPWPVETRCDSELHRCRCDVDLRDCGAGQVVDPLTCRCLPLARGGAACVDDAACASGRCDRGFCAG